MRNVCHRQQTARTIEAKKASVSDSGSARLPDFPATISNHEGKGLSYRSCLVEHVGFRAVKLAALAAVIPRAPCKCCEPVRRAAGLGPFWAEDGALFLPWAAQSLEAAALFGVACRRDAPRQLGIGEDKNVPQEIVATVVPRRKGERTA
jgi:hypothetical protein